MQHMQLVFLNVDFTSFFPLSFSLTVCLLRGVDGVKLTHVGDKAYAGHRLADVRVIPRGARHEVGHGRAEAVLVEQARSARVGHAPPAIRLGVEETRDHREPRVCCLVCASREDGSVFMAHSNVVL